MPGKEKIEELNGLIQEAIQASFSGWDFSYTDQYGGKPESPCPWNYRQAIEKLKNHAQVMLDMGTGGGEFLSTLLPFVGKVIATEAYLPNVEVAKNKLHPLGIEVVAIPPSTQESAPLPFENDVFDLIIDRHEDYDSKELYRTLKAGGYFITQQVGNRDLEKLKTIFGSMPGDEEIYEWNAVTAVNYLQKAGLSIIEAKEHIGTNRFSDIRVVIYFLKVLPWAFPNFDVNRHSQQLQNVYYLIKRDHFFEDICHRFFIIAQKPYK